MSAENGRQFDEEDLKSIVEDLKSRYDGTRGLHERIKWRRAHFHNLPEMDPLLGDQFGDVTKYQSDAPRQTHGKLKARLCENMWLPKVHPNKDTASMRAKANDLERVFTSGNAILQERQMLNLQGDMSDGQIIDAFAVLHWRKADHIWPPVPDHEELDELPEGADATEYTDDEYDESLGKSKKKKFRQTEKSLQEQRQFSQARAGYPWWEECIDPCTFYWLEDRSLENGLALVMIEREVGLLDYVKRLSTEREQISINQVNKFVPIYGEVQAPSEQSPSGSGWKARVTVREVWTRDEYYELVDTTGAGKGGAMTIAKSFAHPYEMPPFAMVPATTINNPDAALRYEPELEGVFRLKPALDRLKTLTMAIAEQEAQPYYYWRSQGGEPYLDENGEKVTFQKNSALANKAPDGYELAKIDFSTNPAMIKLLEQSLAEIGEAMPATGLAEIATGTQPWTARLEQAQQNVEPKLLMTNQERGILTMLRNQAMVMSKSAEDGGFGETVYVFGRDEGGKLDSQSVVGVDPKDIVSLDISVNIAPESSAERITLTQHGMELLDKALITPIEFIRDYMGKPNPDAVYASLKGFEAFQKYLEPGIIQQELAKVEGSKVVLGPNGALIGMGGQELTPQQALQMKGQQPSPMPPAPGGPAPGGAGPMVPGPQMPSMPGLGAPGAIPLQGMQG